MLTWLTETLGTEVVLAETIYEAGREQGFSKNKLIEARDEIKARTFKYGFGKAGAWMWTLKPPSEVTDAEIQAAYLILSDDLCEALSCADAPHPQPLSPDGERGVEDAAAEGSTSKLHDDENSGVLSKKRGKKTGSRRSGTDRIPSSSYDGLSMAELRELALKKLGLWHPPEQAAPELAEAHVWNGQSENGKPSSGDSVNGHSRNGHGRM